MSRVNKHLLAERSPPLEKTCPGLSKGSRPRVWVLVGLWVALCGSFCFLNQAAHFSSARIKIDLPPETGSFKPGAGAEIANGHCLTCHSVEYVVTQPPMARPFWAAEIKKMQEKYGARIPEEQIEPLLNYLARHYGIETNNPAADSSGNKAPQKVNENFSAEVLAGKYGCIGCHNAKADVVGPAFKRVAEKYRHEPAARDIIARQIHTGSSGKWGPAIMPPFPGISEAECRTLGDWVMRQGSAE